MIWIIVDKPTVDSLNVTRPMQCHELAPIQDNLGRWVVNNDIVGNPGNWRHYQAYLQSCDAVNLEMSDFPSVEIP